MKCLVPQKPQRVRFDIITRYHKYVYNYFNFVLRVESWEPELLGEAELIQMRKTTELPSELLLNRLNLLSSVFVTDLEGFVRARERPRC